MAEDTPDCKEKEVERLKFLYEKAIEGRQHHQGNFNHWMNMYAIFNGALFAGYYTMSNNTEAIFKVLIVFLGCAAGWAWHFSSKGFYDWILSWINVVKKQEEKLDTLFAQNGNAVVYRYYTGKKTTSTQKVTKLFSLLAALAWSVLFSDNASKLLVGHFCVSEHKLVFAVLSFGIILLLAVIFYVLTLESDFPIEQME